MKRLETISVECYAGYKGDEAPRRFSMKGKEYAVREVVARWYEEGIDPQDSQKEFFRVLDSDKREYLLRHTIRSDTWELVS
jgi:hypothetical protein